jgi:hypothetical protein
LRLLQRRLVLKSPRLRCQNLLHVTLSGIAVAPATPAHTRRRNKLHPKPAHH